MSIAYFDCFNGAGGDMIVASLIDAGADPDRLRDRLAALGVAGYSLTIERITKQGFAASRFAVHLEREQEQPHRHLRDILTLLDRSDLSIPVRENAARIFTRLAEAEAKVHGVDIDKVHFHEVGAVDAIVDVVGAMIALEMLNVTRTMCSPIPPGSGVVQCEHGTMPVPAPATAELLKGVPLVATEETGELITPTAAAILTTLADRFGPIPAMTIRSIGLGAGTREGKSRPNLLRVMIGEETVGPNPGDPSESDEVFILETNLDDATPELVGHCMERLFAEGALDVYTMPIQMKKSRAGVLLAVLCETGRVSELERIIFAETPTLGVRRRREMRTKLSRRFVSVNTEYGVIRVKIGEGMGTQSISPEYDDCKAAALKHKVPLRMVMAAANLSFTHARDQDEIDS